MNTKELLDEVISLPVEERARLADSILRTLNAPEPEIEHQWVAVAQRRLQELRSGMVHPIAGDDVFTRVWKQLGR